jgi:hypothetical protein
MIKPAGVATRDGSTTMVMRAPPTPLDDPGHPARWPGAGIAHYGERPVLGRRLAPTHQGVTGGWRKVTFSRIFTEVNRVSAANPAE